MRASCMRWIDRLAVDAGLQAHDVEVVRVAGVGGRPRRELERQVAQRLVVVVGELGAARDPAVQAAELVDPHRRRDVVHGELEAGLGDLVGGGPGRAVARPGRAAEPVQREPAGALGGRLGGHDEGAALERRDVLGRVEGERREVAVRADRPALPAGADRVRRVLDDGDPVAVAERVDGVQVDREAGEVDRHDRASPRSDERLGVREVDQARLRIGIHEHRTRAGVLDDVGAGHEGHAGDQDLVAVSDSQQPQGDRQPGRARGEAADVPHVQVFLEACLERRDLRTGGQPAAADGVEQLLDLLLADLRRAEAEVRTRGRVGGVIGRVHGFSPVEHASA